MESPDLDHHSNDGSPAQSLFQSQISWTREKGVHVLPTRPGSLFIMCDPEITSADLESVLPFII
jgi:hypothetical protein